MLKQRSHDEYEAGSEGGVRNLFTLGPYDFHDTMDADDALHHFILDDSAEGETLAYEVDQPTMYEFMARFLAGEFEMREYHLETSPGHQALLDVLEMATARARAGESAFSWDEFDRGDTEILEDGEREDSRDADAGGDDARGSR